MAQAINSTKPTAQNSTSRKGCDTAQHALLERDQGGADAFIHFRVGGCKISRDAGEIRARLADGDAGLQAADTVKAQAGAAIEEQIVVPVDDGSVDVAGGEAIEHQVEVLAG